MQFLVGEEASESTAQLTFDLKDMGRTETEVSQNSSWTYLEDKNVDLGWPPKSTSGKDGKRWCKAFREVLQHMITWY